MSYEGYVHITRLKSLKLDFWVRITGCVTKVKILGLSLSL